MLNKYHSKKNQMLKSMLKNKINHIELLVAYISLLEQRNKSLEKTLREIEMRYV